jgi:lipoyl(octanoyl) transferase
MTVFSAISANTVMPEWQVAAAPVEYAAAVAAMEDRVAAIAVGTAAELIWLLEHPAVYTAGTSAVAADHIGRAGIPVVATGRGGRHTYHGPGQRIVYPLLDLGRRRRDVRCYVHALEGWVITALASLGVAARRMAGDPGIWVDRDGGPAKIGAVGIRVRRWIAFHGVAINVAPALGDFAGIVPCGIADRGVTSLADLGCAATMAQLDAALNHGLPDFLQIIESGGAMAVV